MTTMISFFVGESYLEHMEVWVGPNPGKDGGNAFCNRYQPSETQKTSTQITCVAPVNGRYVTIQVLEQAQLKLCEVKIYGELVELLQLYYSHTP